MSTSASRYHRHGFPTEIIKLYGVLCGTAIGLAASVALTRVVTTLLFGVAPTDALTFATVSTGSLVIALLAATSPLDARRR